jgi:hypothetical protein
MNRNQIQPKPEPARPELLSISYSQRTSGPIKRFEGIRQIADGLSDLPGLTDYAEVEICGINGGRSIWLKVPPLLSNPQIIIGFHGRTGEALLVGVRAATQGNLALIGPSQSGKSTLIGLIWYQLSRLGFFVSGVSLKGTDEAPLASMKAGADSFTRLDKNGKLYPAPFGMLSLHPDEPTKGCNLLAEIDPDRPLSFRAGELFVGLGKGGSENDSDRRYYDFRQLTLLLGMDDLGSSFRELHAKLKALKLDRDTRYATAALFDEIAQLAAMEAVNLSAGHPANIDLIDTIKRLGALYLSACFQDVGPVAIVWASLVIKAIISAKRRIDPSKETLIWLFIDECQLFPLAALKLWVTQCAGAGIKLLCMTQVQIIFGAAANSSTARYLEHLFGTKKEYVPSFAIGSANSSSITESSGPAGDSVAASTTVSTNDGVNLTEREVLCFGPNDRIALNRDRDSFVYYQNPVAELAQWPTAIFGRRAGLHITPEEIKRVAHEAVYNSPNTLRPAKKRAVLAAPAMPPALQEKRRYFLEIFNKAAARIQESVA